MDVASLTAIAQNSLKPGTVYDGNVDGDRIRGFIEMLGSAGFRGDIDDGIDGRLINATDNSIYQVFPAAVIYPRDGSDLNIAVGLAATSPFAPVPLTPRGGGTGTNGQSLTTGVIIDTSRHLNRILDFDLTQETVTVEPGVVLAQLNAFLSKQGLFFPPAVSTATRATIGGMVATDASGKGSRIYGKTSDYILSMDVVLADGSDFKVEPLSGPALERLCESDTISGRACRKVVQTITEHADEIARVFPDMNRGLTGYNLKNAVSADGTLNLHRILSGSEGTLALTKAVRLRVMRKPRKRALVVLRYASFDAALSHVTTLIECNPLAVEIVDDKIIALAQQDIIWASVGNLLSQDATNSVESMNFLEFVGDDEAGLDRQLRELETLLTVKAMDGFIDHAVVRDADAIDQLWTMREKSVGLMGRASGLRQGIAFVEDAAVPPEALPVFIREFRAILDRRGLSYGMYGHADVGCLHVRPAMNMQAPEEASLIRPISDEIASLAKRHGGLLWGEHGRGFRGEYSPFFFGHRLYQELCKIKAAFDPQNIFNPGKLASVPGGPDIQAIDAVALRGEYDRQIGAAERQGYEKAMLCNGNGVCFSWNPADVMCPSYKVTRDRTQSPKGRAALLREWARRRSAVQDASEPSLRNFEEVVHTALSTCLSCKACAGECPVQVDIPSMRSRFLDHYHKTRRRRLRDYLAAAMETSLPHAARLPRAANAILGSSPAKSLIARIGFVDLPSISLRFGPAGSLDLDALAAISPKEKRRHVIFVPDSFTSTFDSDVPLKAISLLRALGYTVHVAPLSANGKALHVLGFRKRFEKLAAAARKRHAAFAATGIAVVGIEAVAVLMDRHEYAEPNSKASYEFKTIDEYLVEEISAGFLTVEPRNMDLEPLQLFPHCTEKAKIPAVGERWKAIFRAFGLNIQVQETGCCGMAGLFGHEREHADMSRELFDMSWRPMLDEKRPGTVLATGFSCRCQIQRLSEFKAQHPVELLADILAGERS